MSANKSKRRRFYPAPAGGSRAPGSDWLVRRELRQLGLAKRSMDYLLTRAAAAHKSPAQIIDEMVLERMAAAAD